MTMRRVAAVLAVLAVPAAWPASVGAAAHASSSNMLVSAVEYRLTLSRVSVPAGHVSVELVDKGMDPHDLALRRYDHHGRLVGPTFALPKVQSGQLESQTVTLTPGTWKLWCTLPGHEMKGMRARLVVRRQR